MEAKCSLAYLWFIFFLTFAIEVALLLWHPYGSYKLGNATKSFKYNKENVTISSSNGASSFEIADEVKQWENSLRKHYSKDIMKTRVCIISIC